MRATWLMVGMLVPWTQIAAQQPLTLQEAVRSALATYPTLAQAEALVARMTATQREQQSSLLPAVIADASLTEFEEPMIVAPLHGLNPLRPPIFDNTLLQGSLILGYTIWDGGARGARLARASAQVAAATAAQQSAGVAVMAETVRRYAALLAVRELVIAHTSVVQALTSERARAAQLLEQGRAARVVLLRASAALSRAEAELAAMQAQLDVAEAELARLTGQHQAALRERALTKLAVGGSVPARAAAIERALSSNHDVRRLRAQLIGASAGEAEARAAWWPRVLLGGRYVRYASGEGDSGGELQGGLQLNYAVFTAGARPAVRDRARAEQRHAAAELAIAELRVAEAVDRAYAELTTARSRSEALVDAIEQSTEVVRIERLALDAGAGVQTDYLNAEAELLRVRASLAEARSAEVVAWVELARAMGVLTPAWIDQNVETAR